MCATAWHHRVKATEVTAGLAESNGSLPPGGWLKNHMPADCLYTGISSGPKARVTSMGKLLRGTPLKKKRLSVVNEQ